MKQWIRGLAGRYFPPLVDRTFATSLFAWANVSYSQEGEDMILARYFERRHTGFYVDIGAHHPVRFSNTYKFYLRGWRGLNVDATPGSMGAFRRLRPRDINIECAIGQGSEKLMLYEFNDPALNTLSEDLARERENGFYRIVREVPAVTKPLEEVLNVYVPAGVQIDFLTIDVEGLDLKVLSSNDWERFRPGYVLAECIGMESLETASTDPVVRFLAGVGYAIIAKTANTLIFRVKA